MTARLEGKVAVVTGAGGGIGEAVARRLASEGAKVLVNDLGTSADGSGSDSGPAARVAESIREAGGVAIPNANDISDHQAASDIIRTAIDEFGDLDILVNTAGILRDRMIFNLSLEDWDAVIKVHLYGHFNLIKFASAHWRDKRNPAGNYRIVNFTSVSGLHGAAGQANYAAAKMGIVGLTFSCANGLARYGVTTNAISPGAFTRMTQTVPQDRLRRSAAEYEEMTPDKIAPVVCYLSGDESRWLNGRIIDVRFNRVALYNIPQQVRIISSEQPWDTESVGAAMERHFKDLAAVPIQMPM
jgi:NAD(P)-dependent dehydrogenase (short-subunit alcohol dehydrogenase family)